MAKRKYDEWRRTRDGCPTLYVRHLFSRWGFRIDLHKIVAPDDLDCFHTLYPAWALGMSKNLKAEGWLSGSQAASV
jgi:hypothetical protein